MDHASAGTAPGLPRAITEESFAYFETEEFFARWRNMFDAFQQGARWPAEELPGLLGCNIRVLSAYLLRNTDESGVARIPIGGGEYAELPYLQRLAPFIPAAQAE